MTNCMPVGANPNDPDSFLITCEPDEKLICCPACKSNIKSSNGKYNRDIRDIPYRRKPVIIHVDAHEYICGNCGKGYVPRLDFVSQTLNLQIE